jgi:hypothetical protein
MGMMMGVGGVLANRVVLVVAMRRGRMVSRVGVVAVIVLRVVAVAVAV